jgi:hypothetical protein
MHSFIHTQIGVITICQKKLLYFFELIQAFCKRHQKIHNDELINMEFKNIKQRKIKRVKVYYKCIQKLAHGL